MLAGLSGDATYGRHLPSRLPSGYVYDRVVFDSARPADGLSVWMKPVASAGTDRGLHIIEAPVVEGTPKDFLRMSGLTPVSLPNGKWLTLQKRDEPWKGEWIYGRQVDGLHIEVDGRDRMLVEYVAGQL